MRIEASPLCPNFRRFGQFHPEVLLDGHPVRHCSMADEELGVVECAAVDLMGNIIVEGDLVVVEQRRGKVRVHFVVDPRELVRK